MRGETTDSDSRVKTLDTMTSVSRLGDGEETGGLQDVSRGSGGGSANAGRWEQERRTDLAVFTVSKLGLSFEDCRMDSNV